MTSKVIVHIPPVPFPLSKKRDAEVGQSGNAGSIGLTSSDPVVRASQLEQNVRFLQEQHSVMLAGLHAELDSLRQRNRDLQFQMIFSKGSVTVMQGPSSTRTVTNDEEQQSAVVVSPGQVNVTPLQIEILERDVAELRTSLSESRTRNVYLQNIVEEQKKKMAEMENEKQDMIAVGKKIGKENRTRQNSELQEEVRDKLEEADRLVRRLRRENEEQRKEIVSMRSSINRSISERARDSSYGTSSYRSYRNSQNPQGQTRFPPLNNQQTYWGATKTSSEFPPNRSGARIDRDPSEVVGQPAPLLPHLKDKSNASSSTGYSNPAYNNYPGGPKRNYYRKPEDGPRRGKGRGGYPPEQSYQNDENNDGGG